MTPFYARRCAYDNVFQTFITKSIHESKTFQENVDLLRSEIDTVSRLLNEYSVPFFSPRYMGHMIWETYVYCFRTVRSQLST